MNFLPGTFQLLLSYLFGTVYDLVTHLAKMTIFSPRGRKKPGQHSARRDPQRPGHKRMFLNKVTYLMASVMHAMRGGIHGRMALLIEVRNPMAHVFPHVPGLLLHLLTQVAGTIPHAFDHMFRLVSHALITVIHTRLMLRCGTQRRWIMSQHSGPGTTKGLPILPGGRRVMLGMRTALCQQ